LLDLESPGVAVEGSWYRSGGLAGTGGRDMAVMGLRCSRSDVRWVALEGTTARPVILNRGRLRTPQNMSRPEELRWLREELKHLLETVRPVAVAFKRAETNVQRLPLARIEAESILQEIAAASGVQTIRPVLKAQIRKAIGFENHARYIGRALDSGPLADVEFASGEEKEAALAGWSALPGAG
jgi:hypothetical protein